jgi:hypothetical protein
VHGCLLDGICLLRCDCAATFLRVGGCLVRTSCIVVGLTLQALGRSLDHRVWAGSGSGFQVIDENWVGCHSG